MLFRGLGLVFVLSLQDRPVRDLLDRMKSDSAADRDRAFSLLRERGRAVEPELRSASGDADPEVAARSRVLLEVLRLRETLPPTLREIFPGIEERLAEHPWEWAETLIEAIRRKDTGDLLHPELGWHDLNILATEALNTPLSADDAQSVCWIVSQHRLRGALPGLHALLGNPDFATRKAALAALVALRRAQSVPFIVRLLDDPGLGDPAADGLVQFRRASVAPALRPLLGHPRRAVRRRLLRVLRFLPDRAGVSLLRDLARDPDPEIGAEAVIALAKMQQDLSADSLIGLFDHPSPGIRKEVFEVLCHSRSPLRGPIARRLLGSPQAELRQYGAGLLEQYQDEESIPDLMALLKDPDVAVRNIAIHGLQACRATQSIPELTRLLTDPSDLIRFTANRALAILGVRDSINFFLAQLRQGSDADRVEALRVLAACRDQASAVDIGWLALTAPGELQGDAIRALQEMRARSQAKVLVPLLVGKEETVAAQAASALSSLDSKETIPMLFGLLYHAEGFVRRRALGVLCQMDAPGLGPHLLRLLGDPESEVRMEAVRSLDSIPYRPAIPRLRAIVADPDHEARFEAASALAELQATEALDDLLGLLTVEAQQEEVVRLLRKMGSRRAVPALSRLLDSGEERTREVVLSLILDLQGPDAAAALRKIVHSASHPLRLQAIPGLARLDPWNAVPDLICCLREPSVAVQDAAADALALLDAPEAVPVLLELLENDVGGMRTSLVDALARQGAAQAAPRILERLRQEDFSVAFSAIDAVGRMGLSQAVPALKELSRGDDLCLRGYAARALARLGDRSEVPALLNGGPRELFTLNRLRRPAVWARLRQTPRGDGLPRLYPDLWAQLACDAGLEFRLESIVHYYWNDWHRNEPCGLGKSTLLDLIEDSLQNCGITFILEEDELQVLPEEAARRFWNEWWRGEQSR